MQRFVTVADDVREKVMAWGELFATELREHPKPCDKRQSELLISIALQANIHLLYDAECKRSYLIQVCEKRIQMLKVNISKSVRYYLTQISCNPAGITMALSYLQWHVTTQLNDASAVIDFTYFNSCIQPRGWLSKNSLKKLWIAQKGYNVGLAVDNLLDLPLAIAALRGDSLE